MGISKLFIYKKKSNEKCEVKSYSTQKGQLNGQIYVCFHGFEDYPKF